MRGQGKRPRRRFRSAQLVIKIKGKSLAGMAEFADDRRRQGYQGVRFPPPSCNRRFRSVRRRDGADRRPHPPALAEGAHLAACRFGFRPGGVDFLFGLAKNSRLVGEIEAELAQAADGLENNGAFKICFSSKIEAQLDRLAMRRAVRPERFRWLRLLRFRSEPRASEIPNGA